MKKLLISLVVLVACVFEFSLFGMERLVEKAEGCASRNPFVRVELVRTCAKFRESTLYIITTMDFPMVVVPAYKDSDEKKRLNAAAQEGQARLQLICYARMPLKRAVRIKFKPVENDQCEVVCKAEYARAVESFSNFLKEKADVSDWESVMSLSKEKLERAPGIWLSVIIDSIHALYEDQGLTKLIIAIELNNDGKLDQWIRDYLSFCASSDEDPGINSCAVSTTALVSAVKKGENDIMRLLVERGALVDLPTDEGATPLIFAAFTNNIEAIIFLLDRGAAIDWQIQNGYTALHAAISQDKNEAIALLLQRKANIELLESASQMTPLLLAITRKSPYAVQLLLSKGANANVLLGARESALMVAIRTLGTAKGCGSLRDENEVNKAKRVVLLLLDHKGVDKEWSNQKGLSARAVAKFHHLEDDDISI